MKMRSASGLGIAGLYGVGLPVLLAAVSAWPFLGLKMRKKSTIGAVAMSLLKTMGTLVG
jgi:hypothetical protein